MSSDEQVRVGEELLAEALRDAKTVIEVVSGKSRAFRPSFDETLGKIDDALRSLATKESEG